MKERELANFSHLTLALSLSLSLSLSAHLAIQLKLSVAKATLLAMVVSYSRLVLGHTNISSWSN